MKKFILGVFARLNQCFALIGAVVAKAAKSIGPREGAMLVGLAMLGYGAGFIFWPAGFILPAIVLLYFALAGIS